MIFILTIELLELIISYILLHYHISEKNYVSLLKSTFVFNRKNEKMKNIEKSKVNN